MNSSVPARLYRVFLSELGERLSDFHADAIALEGVPAGAERTEVVARLLRGAHTLKGAAAAVGASDIEIVCQQTEDLLARVRDGQLELDANRRAELFAAAGQLDAISRRLTDAVPSP